MRILKPLFRSRSVRTLIVILTVLVVLGGALLVTAFNGSSSTTHAATNSASYTFCATYSASRVLWGPNWPLAKVQVNLCADGSHVWQTSGVSCQVQQFTGSVDVTWCGVWNNGGSYLDVGSNFTEHYPWGGNFYCYFRMRVNQYGSITSVWGGC